MKRLLSILVVDSIRELFLYKSFFLLVALLIVLDRLLKHFSSRIQFEFDRGSIHDLQWLAVWIYETLPVEMLDLLLNWKLWVVVLGLFFFQTTDLDVALKRYAFDASQGRRQVEDLQCFEFHKGNPAGMGCTCHLHRGSNRGNLDWNWLSVGVVGLA